MYLDADTEPKFWDYSFEDMGKHDLPSLIKFVIGKTGVKTVSYVGHS